MAIASRTGRRLLHALVAEDDPGIRRLIVGLLEMDGWDVREAADGEQAVAIAGEWHPDAVVIDVMMLGRDGLTAVREIRDQPGGLGRAVVVVSAKHGIEVQAKEAGSGEFVATPFDPEGLSARTRAALRWPAATDAAAADRLDPA